LLPATAIQFLKAWIGPGMLHGISELRAGFVILLNIAYHGSDIESYVRACELVRRITAEDEEEEEEEVHGLVIRFEMPVDGIDPIQMLAEITRVTDFLQGYSRKWSSSSRSWE